MAIISAVIITNESIQFWKEIQNLNFSKKVFLLRSALTAQSISPGIFEVILTAGAGRSVDRIKKLSEALINSIPPQN